MDSTVGHPEGENVGRLAIEVLEEAGIDLVAQLPPDLNDVGTKAYDIAIGFGVIHMQDLCDPGCFRGWPIEDLAGDDIERFRAVRDELRSKIEQLLEEFEE